MNPGYGTLKATMQALENLFDEATQRAAALNLEVIDVAQRNLILSLDFAVNLSRARTLSEIAESQATYSRNQFDVLAGQLEEARRWLFGLGPGEPERRGPSRKCPASAPACAPATRTQEHDLRETPERKFEPPFPAELGPASPEAQPRRSVPKDKPKRRTRDAIAELNKVKARPSSSGKGKRADAEKPTVPQVLSAKIKFGMLDGNAVRFTGFEAWWLVNGIWRPIAPDEVVLNAIEMREVRFDQLFPQVPRLPTNAFQSAMADERERS